MRSYNFQLSRVSKIDGWESSVQLPQFNIWASDSEEARKKCHAILNTNIRGEHATNGLNNQLLYFVGAVTDGDTVWDFKTGMKL